MFSYWRGTPVASTLYFRHIQPPTTWPCICVAFPAQIPELHTPIPLVRRVAVEKRGNLRTRPTSPPRLPHPETVAVEEYSGRRKGRARR